MTIHATLQQKKAEPASIPWTPMGQGDGGRHAPRSASNEHATRLLAELDRQADLVHRGSMVAEDLRGIRALFRGVFCADMGTPELTREQTAAAYVIADCLESMADRLDSIEEQSRESLQHAKAGAAR